MQLLTLKQNDIGSLRAFTVKPLTPLSDNSSLLQPDKHFTHLAQWAFQYTGQHTDRLIWKVWWKIMEA